MIFSMILKQIWISMIFQELWEPWCYRYLYVLLRKKANQKTPPKQTKQTKNEVASHIHNKYLDESLLSYRFSELILHYLWH